MSEQVIGVVLQPSYVPWRGVFDLIHRADVFVFYDDVQFDKHGWRNRNRIKTAAGSQWLTIPVKKKGNVESGLRICDTRIDWTAPWAKKHVASLRQSYARAPHVGRYMDLLAPFFEKRYELLSDFTIDTTCALAEALGIATTRFVRSSTLTVEGAKNDRLLEVLRAVGVTHYISGPSAKDYIDTDAFARANIGLEYIVYDYPEYTQLHPPYDPQVSILDLLFMTGEGAPDYIWGKYKEERAPA